MKVHVVVAAFALTGALGACSTSAASTSAISQAPSTSTTVISTTIASTPPPSTTAPAPSTKRESAKEYLRISEFSRAATTAWNKMPQDYSSGAASHWRKACKGMMNADAKQMEAYAAWQWSAKTEPHIDDLVGAIARDHESMRQCIAADDPGTFLATIADANGDAMAAATKARLTLGLPVNRS